MTPGDSVLSQPPSGADPPPPPDGVLVPGERLSLGVAANGPLRVRLAQLGGVSLGIPPRALCTDNAAMIASAARFTDAQPFPDS
ncbi:MAG: tRNA N6-adenosine threonylcarbamoyltransferase, partial [bacterium]